MERLPEAGSTAGDAMRRRKFLEVTAGVGAALGCIGREVFASADTRVAKSTFRLWTMGCSHVGTDKRQGRESLAEAIRHSERGAGDGAPPFAWDVALHLGDLSGAQGPPHDDEGREVVRQFAAARKHRR